MVELTEKEVKKLEAKKKRLRAQIDNAVERLENGSMNIVKFTKYAFPKHHAINDINIELGLVKDVSDTRFKN